MKRIMSLGLVCIIVLYSVTSLSGQKSNEDLAKAAANPLASMISIPFQNNMELGLGDYNRTRNVLNIQPVIPLAGGKIITRTIFPVVWLPDISAESGSYSSGLSDTQFTAFYVPPSKGNLTWGPGMVLEIPTGGEKRGSQKWSFGPSIVVLAQPGDWTMGILANNVWSVAGNSDRHSVNKGLINLFLVRQLGGGLYVNSAPIISVNWKAPDGQKWIVPLGAGVGKLLRLGKLPVNVQVGAYYNIVKPDIGPKWQVRLQAQFILPMSIFQGK
ncbi:neuromedin U [Acidobacteriota bacterium]